MLPCGGFFSACLVAALGTVQVIAGGANGEAQPPLDQWVGWLVVIGFGLFFSFLAVGFAKLEERALVETMTSEQFNTAGRNVGAGLIAAVIVSQWTWAATLLQSANMGWRVGIAGPYWYAAGASVQILLFSVLAIQVKRRCSNMHTFLEIIRVRWGSFAHIVFICFALCTNILVTGMLMLGGAEVIEDLTGVPVTWSSLILPFSSCLVYTLRGGLKATFFSAYLNTVIIFATLLLFIFTVYASPGGDLSASVGSPDRVFEGLQRASARAARFAFGKEPNPPFPFTEGLVGNSGICVGTSAEIDQTGSTSCRYTQVGSCAPGDDSCASFTPSLGGQEEVSFSHDCADPSNNVCAPSFLTLASNGGIIFGVVNLVGNFGTVFVDQSYWQSAVACKPRATVQGYLLGGMVWFAVPFAFATTVGLAARSMAGGPEGIPLDFVTAFEANAGLVPARVLQLTMGVAGSFLLLLMLFMAITSTGASELIAASSILVYDVFVPYLQPSILWGRAQRQALLKKAVGRVRGEGEGARNGDWREDEEEKQRLCEGSSGALQRSSASSSPVPVESSSSPDSPGVAVDSHGTGVGGREDSSKRKEGDEFLTEKEALSVLETLSVGGFFPSSSPPESPESVRTESQAEGETDALWSLVGGRERVASLSGLPSSVPVGRLVVPLHVFLRVVQRPCEREDGLLLLRVSKACTVLFSCFMGLISVFLQGVRLQLGFLYMTMGVLVGPAVAPCALSILWQRANGRACTFGALGGLLAGLSAWLGASAVSAGGGGLSVEDISGDMPFLYGNVASILVSAVIAVGGSLLLPDVKFRWSQLNDGIQTIDGGEEADEGVGEEEEKVLRQWHRVAVWSAVALSVVLLLLFPLPPFFSNWVFDLGAFRGWVGVSIGWAVAAAVVVTVLPVIEFVQNLRGAGRKEEKAKTETGKTQGEGEDRYDGWRAHCRLSREGNFCCHGHSAFS
uniref:Urea-proton symporter DUR3 n=1 Tax=Chromera velia CCMP2878 TaxID=1169474 RepID=A0A0G4FGI3_9ALVE|eukprot:Cvel_16797.t1-p1 / transcript=Cvel_16797.t1 / gene=Cvel_16797 / organism=Chromera_velia_CCMP2878 / gene_product=Urea-proton symporter DUR3, putative / transcript_product=Urea-proton symporter DUR3, putative / location=Cvel_scaffold1311:33238-37991(+) / protein_length=961 / sequence_SO=supercontig / SO=protein_coding / is_pseudo=false